MLGSADRWAGRGRSSEKCFQPQMSAMVTDSSFAGRVALVTGGSRGIGRAVALEVARRGADMAVAYANNESAAKEVADEIQSFGRQAVAVHCDVSSQSGVESAVSSVRDQLGPIELLVHSAGIWESADHTQLTEERWTKMMDVNLTGTYRVIWAVKDEMIQRQFGRIVTIGSIAALVSRPAFMHYSVSKAAVIAMTRTCAEAFAPHIRINCVAPGLIETDMTSQLPQEAWDQMIAGTPLQRVGQPHDIAKLVCFLLSEESSYTPGQTVIASGGRITIP